MPEQTWPWPWRPIDNERAALAFGKSINADVADTVLDELARELSPGHVLYGAVCRVLAYDSLSKREFLISTNRADMPYVVAHFTWHHEPSPQWPTIAPFRDLAAFARDVRRRYLGERIRRFLIFGRSPA